MEMESDFRMNFFSLIKKKRRRRRSEGKENLRDNVLDMEWNGVFF